jgi:hypothetical protein
VENFIDQETANGYEGYHHRENTEQKSESRGYDRQKSAFAFPNWCGEDWPNKRNCSKKQGTTNTQQKKYGEDDGDPLVSAPRFESHK